MTGLARIQTTIFACRIINLTSRLECKDKLKIMLETILLNSEGPLELE
jgi:hypothetical protein